MRWTNRRIFHSCQISRFIRLVRLIGLPQWEKPETTESVRTLLQVMPGQPAASIGSQPVKSCLDFAEMTLSLRKRWAYDTQSMNSAAAAFARTSFRAESPQFRRETALLVRLIRDLRRSFVGARSMLPLLESGVSYLASTQLGTLPICYSCLKLRPSMILHRSH